MGYIEFGFKHALPEHDLSQLVAELLESGFDSFHEDETTLYAYLPENLNRPDLLDEVRSLRNHPVIVTAHRVLENKNWNREWESNYEPVTIAGKCHVRAPFHPDRPEFPYQIIIEPKMAFGTAHHETTRLMAEELMKLDVKGKTLLDMGCGTGILAILAAKLGAVSVLGIDNDEWAFRNARENFAINGLNPEHVLMGDASADPGSRFDVILANINRNVLLNDLQSYSGWLKPGGDLLLSGFYTEDTDVISAAAVNAGLAGIGASELNHWAVLHFIKRNS